MFSSSYVSFEPKQASSEKVSCFRLNLSEKSFDPICCHPSCNSVAPISITQVTIVAAAVVVVITPQLVLQCSYVQCSSNFYYPVITRQKYTVVAVAAITRSQLVLQCSSNFYYPLPCSTTSSSHQIVVCSGSSSSHYQVPVSRTIASNFQHSPFHLPSIIALYYISLILGWEIYHYRNPNMNNKDLYNLKT